MLSAFRIFATVSVSDIEKAKEFYGGTLGLVEVEQNEGGVEYASGGGSLFVYPSETAGSGEATAAGWQVEDASVTAVELAEKGIVFEHYEFPGAVMDGDVHLIGGGKAAWFKDPDGNILHIVSEVPKEKPRAGFV
jgi:catechol 2,3-dioxygenase-like lactoylglutathione lyase family enzyme